MPRPKTDKKRVNLYLPEKHIAAAKTIATKTGISFSELIRDALTKHLRDEVTKLKAAQ
jgi:predicted DNA binding CopG/RHH family protein